MTCDERDQELLLLAHGALSLPRRLVVRAHLRQCAACRERYERMAQVSSALSAALAPPAQRPWAPVWNWKPTGTRGATLGARMLAVFSALLIILAATILYVAFSNPRASCANRATPAAPKSPDGCSPYLPNDHCR